MLDAISQLYASLLFVFMEKIKEMTRMDLALPLHLTLLTELNPLDAH